MKFKGVFPEFYRAFAHGETAVCMERYGGIDELSLIDVEEKDGVPFPDNHYLKIFSRQGRSSGRPLCGSAIRFLNLSQDGTQDYLYPEDPDVHPWGVLSRNFTFFIDCRRLCFLCSRPDSRTKTLRMVISTEHLFRGERPAIKNQRMTPCALRICQEAGIRPDPDKPFPNGIVTLDWKEPVFRHNGLIFSGELTYPYGKRSLYLAVLTGKKAVLTRSSALLMLDIPWQNEKQMTVAAAFGASEEQAVAAAGEILADPAGLCRKKCLQDRHWDRTAAKISCPVLPAIGSFFSEQNRYLHALLVAGGIGIRAATYKFSFFAMWDAIFPIRDFLRNGEFSQAKKMFRYLLHYPSMEYFPWGSMHLVIMLEEILSYGQDRELFQESCPVLEKFFAFARLLTSPETGLIATANNCGTDVLKEMGIDGLHYAVCVNAFYYNALRIMENFAAASGRDASPYRTVRKKIEESYMQCFYDEKAGYLRLALARNGSPAPVTVYENTATIGLEGPFGEFLLHEKIRELAEYQTKKLRHPLGRLAVSHDSLIPCEMWRNVHMNQHLGHEMILARLGGRVPEVHRVMQEYFKIYRQYGVAVETFNTAGCDGNSSQTANWQSFSATAAATAVQTGLAGIRHDGGGYSYLPAEDSGNIRLRNLPFGDGARLHISLEGAGSSARMFFNGQEIRGSLQLPEDLPAAAVNRWQIIRCPSPSAAPVLLSAAGLPVRNLTAGRTKVSFTAGRTGSFPIHFTNTRRVLLNQKTIFTTRAGSAFLDLDVRTGDQITLER